MDFTLSSEQVLIRDSVARFAASGAVGDPWPAFAEFGWLGIGAPESADGFGGPVETLIVSEQLGRGLVVSDYTAQRVIAGRLLACADRLPWIEQLTLGQRRFSVAFEEPSARFDPSLARTRIEGGLLSGRKVRVAGGTTADTFLVSACEAGRVVLVAVDRGAPGVLITSYDAEDGHNIADVQFERVAVDSGDRLDGDALAMLEDALDHGTAALCAEALGLMVMMLEMTVAYTKQRQQFGVAIASFQALQHRMAEMFIELELARSMAYRAAMALDAGDSASRNRDVAAAKVQIARSGRFIGQNAIQLHGGIGMSEEYRVGHYFKRMTILERLYGDERYHLARYLAHSTMKSQSSAESARIAVPA